MPMTEQEIFLNALKYTIEDLNSTKDDAKKREILRTIYLNGTVPATFYIDFPGTELAAKLYQIASECTQGKEGQSVTHGDIWKTLIPTLQNTETACRFPLPGYDGRQNLILTANGTHLLSIQEMSDTCDADPSLHSLPNLHKPNVDSPNLEYETLTSSEQKQIFEKAPDLWHKYYNLGEPWLSQQTFEKLLLIVNIALSIADEIDGKFSSRFAEGLSEDADFKKFYQDNFEKTVLSIGKMSDRNALQLTCCFKYFEFYLKKLSSSEQAAFKLIQLRNRNLYENLIEIDKNGRCMSDNAHSVASFVIALANDDNKKKWKNNLTDECRKYGAKIAGSLQHLVKTSGLREEKQYVADVTNTTTKKNTANLVPNSLFNSSTSSEQITVQKTEKTKVEGDQAIQPTTISKKPGKT